MCYNNRNIEGEKIYGFKGIQKENSQFKCKRTKVKRFIFKRYGFMKVFFKSIDYLKESITVVSSGCTHKESYIVDIGNSLLDTQFIGMRNLIRQKKAEK